jgi:hypothetical protein
MEQSTLADASSAPERAADPPELLPFQDKELKPGQRRALNALRRRLEKLRQLPPGKWSGKQWGKHWQKYNDVVAELQRLAEECGVDPPRPRAPADPRATLLEEARLTLEGMKLFANPGLPGSDHSGRAGYLWRRWEELFPGRVPPDEPVDCANDAEVRNKICGMVRELEAMGPAPEGEYVDLDMIAARVHRKKRGLEHYKTRRNDPLPEPDVPGGGGRKDLWLWSNVRPWMERTFNMRLPEHYPNPFAAADSRG